MKPWIATALLFLLAVPYQTYWADYEMARRGLLALLVGVLCVFLRTIPRQTPARIWPFALLGFWVLARALTVPNVGYGLEAACHMLALAALVVFGTGMSMRSVLRATLPTGIVVALCSLGQGLGYSLIDTHEAVSTLGNRNVASELLAVCGAAAALLAADVDSNRRDRILGLTTLVLCAMAVMWNTSLSGKIALPLGCLPCLLHKGRWPVLASVCLGGLLGLLPKPVHVPAPTSAIPTPPLAAAASDANGSTSVAVRKALWKGTLNMIENRPVLGHGSGQFQIQYSRFRTKDEIELTSFGRRFQTSPYSAHNDYLQILADLGVIGLLLALAAAFVVLRFTPIRFWGPLLAFAMLAGVRAPLGNAPTAALVFLFAGALLGRQHTSEARTIPLTSTLQVVKKVALGIMMMWFGASQLFAQFATVGYVEWAAQPQSEAKNDAWPEAFECVEQALAFRPAYHDMRLERARVRLMREATLADGRRDMEYLLQTAGPLPAVQVRYAELLNAERNPVEAMKVLNLLRAKDPENQRAIQVSVLILVRQKQAPAAVLLLYRSKHARTRENLARTLGGLAQESRDPGDIALLRCEQAFVEVLDQIARHPKGVSTVKAVGKFTGLRAKLPDAGKDMRALALNAVVQLHQNQRASAEALAGVARSFELLPTHRAMMADVLAPLQALPGWRAILGD